MSNDFITFNAVVPYSHLLLISASSVGEDLPSIHEKIDTYKANSSALYFSTADIVADFDASLRVIIGNIDPSKMHKLLTVPLDVTEGRVYIGDVYKETYSLLRLPKGSINLSIYADAESHATIFYVYIDVHQIRLIKRRTLHEPSEDVGTKIIEIGKKDGCHICGSKTEASYIPHLLPPLEIDTDSEKQWYPICRRDYREYEQEIHDLLVSVI